MGNPGWVWARRWVTAPPLSTGLSMPAQPGLSTPLVVRSESKSFGIYLRSESACASSRKARRHRCAYGHAGYVPGYLVKAKRPAAVAARALTTPSTTPSVPTATDADELATWAESVWGKATHTSGGKAHSPLPLPRSWRNLGMLVQGWCLDGLSTHRVSARRFVGFCRRFWVQAGPKTPCRPILEAKNRDFGTNGRRGPSPTRSTGCRSVLYCNDSM